MDVLMPQLGETVAEGKITKWFKSAGDAVKPGDNLFEIETDKVSMEVPSIAAGTLTEIRVQAGEVAPVGAVVAVIAGEGGAAASAPAAQAAHRSSRQPRRSRLHRSSASGPRAKAGPRLREDAMQAASASDSIRSSRCARRRATSARRRPRAARPSRRWRAGSPARTASICRACRGSGPHGRIVAARRRSRDRQRRGPRRAAWRPARRPRRSRRSTRASSSRKCRSTACARPSRARLVEAKQTIPHFYLTADVTMDALLQDPRGGQRRRAESGEAAPTSSRSTISSSRRWRSRCSACPPRTRCGPATASCASSIPTSASRSRSTAACSRR